jgi:hypothetical protein
MKGELMLKKGTERSMRRWRAVALVTFGLAIGITMTATPAAGHVGGTVSHLWNQHIKPKADARYANAVSGTDKAKDADKIDGLNSTAFFLGSGGADATFVNITGCSTATLVSYSVTVSRTSRILGFVAVEGFADSGGPHGPLVTVQLLDSTPAVVASSPRGRGPVGAGNNNTLSTSGLLLATAGPRVPYEISPGEYTLRLMGENQGACDSSDLQYQGIHQSHVLIPSSG